MLWKGNCLLMIFPLHPNPGLNAVSAGLESIRGGGTGSAPPAAGVRGPEPGGGPGQTPTLRRSGASRARRSRRAGPQVRRAAGPCRGDGGGPAGGAPRRGGSGTPGAASPRPMAPRTGRAEGTALRSSAPGQPHRFALVFPQKPSLSCRCPPCPQARGEQLSGCTPPLKPRGRWAPRAAAACETPRGLTGSERPSRWLLRARAAEMIKSPELNHPRETTGEKKRETRTGRRGGRRSERELPQPAPTAAEPAAARAARGAPPAAPESWDRGVPPRPAEGRFPSAACFDRGGLLAFSFFFFPPSLFSFFLSPFPQAGGAGGGGLGVAPAPGARSGDPRFRPALG